MLTGKYKLKPEFFKFDAPYFGFAKCCGVTPKVNFDPANPSARYQVGAIACPICDNQVGVIANGPGPLPEQVGFLYQNWNRAIKAPLANIPEGFAWGEVSVTHYFMGGKVEKRLHFRVLKNEGNKWFNYCMYRNQIVELELPAKGRSVAIDTGEISCTDGTSWKSFRFDAFNQKWKKQLEEFLVVSLDSEPYRY
jgi:hypothetical protein